MKKMKMSKQSTDSQNSDSVNARGAKAKGSSHGQSPKFGQTDTEPGPKGRKNA